MCVGEKSTNLGRSAYSVWENRNHWVAACAAVAQPGGRSLRRSRGRLASCLEFAAADRSASEQQSKSAQAKQPFGIHPHRGMNWAEEHGAVGRGMKAETLSVCLALLLAASGNKLQPFDLVLPSRFMCTTPRVLSLSLVFGHCISRREQEY